MAALFQVKVPTINEHLKTLYADGELQPEATIRKFLIVRQEGTRQVSSQIDHYNRDAILAVGYRVRSTRGTQFRRGATERLRTLKASTSSSPPGAAPCSRPRGPSSTFEYWKRPPGRGPS